MATKTVHQYHKPFPSLDECMSLVHDEAPHPIQLCHNGQREICALLVRFEGFLSNLLYIAPHFAIPFYHDQFFCRLPILLQIFSAPKFQENEIFQFNIKHISVPG